MQIIIAGCGKVGTTLVEQLSGEGNNVTVIDQNYEKVQDLASEYDVMGVVGNAASHRIQPVSYTHLDVYKRQNVRSV